MNPHPLPTYHPQLRTVAAERTSHVASGIAAIYVAMAQFGCGLAAIA